MKRILYALCMLLSFVFILSAPAIAEELPEAVRELSGDDYALRSVSWDMNADEVAAKENGTVDKDGNVVLKEDLKLYKLPALRLTYLYDGDGQMRSRSFRLEKKQLYYNSVYVSLLMRYGSPYYSNHKDHLAVWMLDDARIELCMTNYVFVIFGRLPEPETKTG